jgi:hypothetical protein
VALVHKRGCASAKRDEQFNQSAFGISLVLPGEGMRVIFFSKPAGAGEAGTKGDSVLLVTGEEVGGRRDVVKVNAEVARLHRILVCVFATSVILFKSLGQQETIRINF